ncbi:MAG: glucuronate isomerase [Verrucomicrobia bacterium]|nr:glucuronate isomerase [Verrucomicrobiota bacterium]
MDKPFLSENFLLSTPTSETLYFEFAESLPLFDYHCHIPPADIAANRRFENLTQIWLAEGRYGDHYKWRAMRANGVPERFITGDASDYEKFLAYARTVPATVRNPLYHWTHLELRRYFGITELLNEESAPRIWAQANEQLHDLTVHQILEKFRVSVVCTTDDPTDDLAHHQAIRASGLKTRVYPAYRPDKAFAIDHGGAFRAWVERLEKVSGAATSELTGLLAALRTRHGFFGSLGAKLSDHGIPFCYSEPCNEAEASAIYARARSGAAPTEAEASKFRSFMLRFFAELDADAGWTKQLHLGALRNTNRRRLSEFGPDTGYDSIGDWPQAEPLARFLDGLETAGKLPKLILYNVNPSDNYALATMIGNFQDGSIPGKLQFGSGWWFLDQKEGMTWQLNALSNVGLLSRFVGMLTDSRSFMSYPRHEYFRRLLCDLVGADVERGEIPNDPGLLGPLIHGICFENARAYFGLECGQV